MKFKRVKNSFKMAANPAVSYMAEFEAQAQCTTRTSSN